MIKIELSSDTLHYKRSENYFRHRIDKPAIINSFVRLYYMNNKIHRLNGPAIEYYDNISNQYWINGIKFFSERDYWRTIKKLND